MPIDSHLSYLEKHAFVPPQLHMAPPPNLTMVVVIPCMDDFAVHETLIRLAACETKNFGVEVIVVLYGSELLDARFKERLLQLRKEIEGWAHLHRRIDFACHVLFHDNLPKRHAGLGLARKIGMDEAVHRFLLTDRGWGWIISLDPEALVTANFLSRFHHWSPQYDCYTMDFRYQCRDPRTQLAMTHLELAQRVQTAALQQAGCPLAVNIGGGAFAVSFPAYQAQGGMNRRKVGEDIDFLQKYMELGRHQARCDSLVTIVARASDRYPGGVRYQLSGMLARGGAPNLAVPDLSAYQDFARVVAHFDLWYERSPQAIAQDIAGMPLAMARFLTEHKAVEAITEVQRYTTSLEAYKKRMWRWMHYHRIQTYLHQYAAMSPSLLEAAQGVMQWIAPEALPRNTETSLLEWFQNW